MPTKNMHQLKHDTTNNTKMFIVLLECKVTIKEVQKKGLNHLQMPAAWEY